MKVQSHFKVQLRVKENKLGFRGEMLTTDPGSMAIIAWVSLLTIGTMNLLSLLPVCLCLWLTAS